MSDLKEFYELDARRFWNPLDGITGRDKHIYPLIRGIFGSVLEYGCGSGSLLLHLAKENRFTCLTGVDISTSALNAISNSIQTPDYPPEAASKISLIEPVSDQLPAIQSNSIDLVLSLDTIEHVINPYKVIDELYRVTRPGGMFIISVPNYGYIKYVVQLLFGVQPITGSDFAVSQWREAGWDGYHLHTFTINGLKTLLQSCGWKVVQVTGYGSKGRNFGLSLLRARFPRLFSGALTCVCLKS